MRSDEKKSRCKEGRDKTRTKNVSRANERKTKRRGMVREDLNKGKKRMRKSVIRCK